MGQREDGVRFGHREGKGMGADSKTGIGRGGEGTAWRGGGMITGLGGEVRGR